VCGRLNHLHFPRVLNTLRQAGPAPPETRAGRCFLIEHDGGANFTYASKTRVTLISNCPTRRLTRPFSARANLFKLVNKNSSGSQRLSPVEHQCQPVEHRSHDNRLHKRWMHHDACSSIAVKLKLRIYVPKARKACGPNGMNLGNHIVIGIL